MEVEQEILAHYGQGRERERLTAAPSLELLRTKILLERHLPAPPARVLDVGGASGVYAGWLAGLGYDVHLVDPVPLHLDQAAEHGGFRVSLGDARQLAEEDGSYDVVMLLGPLYHLVERDDRLRALAEARRVVRPGGTVAVAAISRYASTYEGYFRGHLDRPGFEPLMRAGLHTGQHRNPDDHPRFFTTSYFHDVAGLRAEVTGSGLALDHVLPVEGMLDWMPDVEQRLVDPAHRELIFEALDVMAADPTLTGATSHLLAFAHR